VSKNVPSVKTQDGEGYSNPPSCISSERGKGGWLEDKLEGDGAVVGQTAPSVLHFKQGRETGGGKEEHPLCFMFGVREWMGG